MISFEPISYLFFDYFVLSVWMLMLFFGILITSLLSYFYCKKSKDLDEKNCWKIIALLLFIFIFTVSLRYQFSQKLYSLLTLLVIIISLSLFFKYSKLGLEYLVLAMFVPIGMAIGRIGCFLNWDDYGIPTTLPWGISVGNSILPVHPTQLYLVLLNLVLFAILFKLKDVDWFKSRKGSIFLMWLI